MTVEGARNSRKQALTIYPEFGDGVPLACLTLVLAKHSTAKWADGRQIGRGPSSRWLYPNLVIDGTANALFASEVTFRGLNGNVAKQKLDLLQFLTPFTLLIPPA